MIVVLKLLVTDIYMSIATINVSIISTITFSITHTTATLSSGDDSSDAMDMDTDSSSTDIHSFYH